MMDDRFDAVLARTARGAVRSSDIEEAQIAAELAAAAELVAECGPLSDRQRIVLSALCRSFGPGVMETPALARRTSSTAAGVTRTCESLKARRLLSSRGDGWQATAVGRRLLDAVELLSG